MGLARTPPQKAGQLLAEDQQDVTEGRGAEQQGETSEGNITGVTYPSIASPTRAFMPRKPGVMRSPQPASPGVYPSPPSPVHQQDEPAISSTPERVQTAQHVDERPIAAAPRPPPVGEYPDNTMTNYGEESMDIDEPSVASTEPEISTPTRPVTASFDFVTPAQPGLRSIPQSGGAPLPPPTPADSSMSSSIAVNDPVTSVTDPTSASMPPPPVSPPTRPSRSSFTTPKASQAPKTPRSTRKTPAEIARVLATPAQPLEPIPMVYVPEAPKPTAPEPAEQTEPDIVIPDQSKIQGDALEPTEDYGRRWKKVNETLQLVIDQILKKWTASDLKKTLPTLAARDKAGVERIHAEVVANFRDYVKAAADVEFKTHNMGISLQRIDDVVAEAEEYERTRESEHARLDAWRPNLSPAALVMAQILPVYDEAWDRLRTEYLELHEDSRQRYNSIMAKQAQLRELEGSVSDGVIELEQTIKLLDGFPNEDMMKWMEDKASVVGNTREP